VPRGGDGVALQDGIRVKLTHTWYCLRVGGPAHWKSCGSRSDKRGSYQWLTT